MKKKKKISFNVPRSITRLYPNIKSVEESDKYVKISVSKKDCIDGKILSSTECALARAAKREFHADAVIIGITSSYIIKDNKAIRFETPNQARIELVSFDRHHDFEPGEYYLKPKPKSHKLGNYCSSGIKSGKHTPKRSYHKTARVRILNNPIA